MADKTATQHQAAQDGSRFPSLIVVSGTAGTADTSGTAEIVRAGGNPTTGAQYIEIIGGTLNAGTVVTNETEVTGFNGGTVSIGTSPTELTFTGVTQSIMVTADHNNGTMIYLGPGSVAQDGANAVVRLDPGESCSMDLNDASAAIYAVAGTTAQKVYKAALT